MPPDSPRAQVFSLERFDRAHSTGSAEPISRPARVRGRVVGGAAGVALEAGAGAIARNGRLGAWLLERGSSGRLVHGIDLGMFRYPIVAEVSNMQDWRRVPQGHGTNRPTVVGSYHHASPAQGLSITRVL